MDWTGRRKTATQEHAVRVSIACLTTLLEVLYVRQRKELRVLPDVPQLCWLDQPACIQPLDGGDRDALVEQCASLWSAYDRWRIETPDGTSSSRTPPSTWSAPHRLGVDERLMSHTVHRLRRRTLQTLRNGPRTSRDVLEKLQSWWSSVPGRELRVEVLPLASPIRQRLAATCFRVDVGFFA